MIEREFINSVQLMGVVGNASVQEYGEGRLLCRFSLVTQRKEQTYDGYPVVADTWHNCVVHSSPELPDVKKIARGSYLNLRGSMRNVGYIQPAGPCSRTEIAVSEFEILEG